MARAGERVGDALEFQTPVLPLKAPALRHCQTAQVAPAALVTSPQAITPESPIAAEPSHQDLLAKDGIPTTASNSDSGRVEVLPFPPSATADHQPLATSANPPSDSLRSPTAPAPIAPPETLPLKTISDSQPVPPPPADTHLVRWCKVRVQHTGTQPAPHVAVSIASPPEAQLVAREPGAAKQPEPTRLEFPSQASFAPQAEQTFVVGLIAAEETACRLRVQIRDGLGGTHGDVQRRWNVIIEPFDATRK